MFESTAELTRAMARGEREAIEVFYRRYFDWMFRVAAGCTRRDEAFCLDVVHDSVLRVVRAIKPMDSVEHLERWLRRVVRTSGLDRLRADQRRARREAASSPAREAPHTNGFEQAELLAAALSKLDPQIVRLIELRYTEGHTLARLAQTFGSTTGAIDGRLRRAIESIRRHWREK